MSRGSLSLDGRVLLVTGGARGIGFATARAGAERGATVVLVDRDPDVGAAARSLGRRALGIRADVTDLEGLQTAVEDVVEDVGCLDVVVANAGIGPKATTVEAGDREHQRAVLDTNLHGVWHTAWATIPHVVRQRGHFVLVSSVAAFLPAPMWAAYAVSKAAVEQLARSMRLELAVTGTTVGVAHFGLIDTELVASFEADRLSAEMSEAMKGRLPTSLTQKADVREAATALTRGIERRRARTLYPVWWWGPYLLRGVTTPAMEALGIRSRQLRTLLGEARARDHADVPQRELAS